MTERPRSETTPAPVAPIVVLVGPAGCGKTTVGRALAGRLGARFVDGDDLHDPADVERMRSGEPLDDRRRGPWLDRIRAEITAAAAAGEALVVGCSALRRSYRDRLADGLPAVRFVQLGLDEPTLRRRLAERTGHFFPATLLDSQLAAFEPLPERDRVDAGAPPEAVATAVLARLGQSRDARIVDGAALPVYDLGSDHPFARDRQQPLFDLLRCTALVDEADLLSSAPLLADELAAVHDPEYVGCLIATSMPRPDAAVLARAARFGLGPGDNPIAEGQHDAAAAVAGASRAAVDAVLAGECRAAFNPAGGLHHAMPHGAAGFCLYNDLALAIRRARERGCDRVLYVDFDVHHGDGVEFTFRDDPTVLTVSFHEDPRVRYPGTGFVEDVGRGDGRGYALNVPLLPGTDDASFASCTGRVLAAAFAGFRPDLVVSQHGCDTHRDDPLATLGCTTRAARDAARLTRRLADRHCGGRWVATGGGGYLPYTVIPRAWSMVWAELCGAELPELPDEWRQRWAARAGVPMPLGWLDEEREPDPGRARVAAANERTVEALFELVPWLGSAAS